MTDLTSIRETVEALGYTFHEFKEMNEARLRSLEQKDTFDPLDHEKMKRMEDEMHRLQQKISSVEKKAKRPNLGTVTWEGDEPADSQLFFDYVKKGVDGGLERKDLLAGSEGSGVYVFPSVTSDKIYNTLKDGSFFRQFARVIPMTSSSLEILVSQKEPEAVWAQETSERKATETPDLIKRIIPAHELCCKPRASQRFLDDGGLSVEGWLIERVTHQLLEKENEAFISGNGEHKPKGFLSYENTTDSYEWGKIESVKTGVAGGFSQDYGADNLIKLLHTLKNSYLSKGRWLMSRSALSHIRQMKNDSHYLWQPSLVAGTPETFLGYPVHVLETMPQMREGTNSSPIAFGNFEEGYTIVDHKIIKLLRDPYSSKPYVEFYITRRVGGDVTNFEAIKVLRCSE